MQTVLKHWQEKLDIHFRELADKRRESGLPLFAIEHRLNVDEVEQIGELLREHFSERSRLESCWLLWVVYATEIGYCYGGDEYWQSFEDQTQGWKSHHRYELRQCFEKFQQTYHGFKPSGRWAKYFKIIAWPITHAILPKYLQHQFAQALYQQRFRLARIRTCDSASIGRSFSTYTRDAAARFENFLQQEELTGRIILGMSGLLPESGQEPIYSQALERIVGDLNRVRKTRYWLKDTRKIIDRFKGVGQGMGPSARQLGPANEDDSSNDAFVQPDIRPNLLLRYSGSDRWAVMAEIPNFSQLGVINSDLHYFLKRTRCRVSDSVGMKSAGWTLSGTRMVVLESWPNASKPLLVFEHSCNVLEQLLESDCWISSGPNWLFRISADGRAREIRYHNVRPNISYILISSETEKRPTLGSFVSECDIECKGVHAVKIKMPPNPSAEDIAYLKNLGLDLVRTIRVWPTGFPCRGWDGEGQSEWLTTECPQLGIVHDHPVDSYEIRLDDGVPVKIEASDPGIPIFIRLDPLCVGKHRMTVTANANGQSLSDDSMVSGYLDLKVREPEPWIPGIPAHSGLIVETDPYDANLDEFWTNKITLSISGPESHTVECFLSLRDSAENKMLCEKLGLFQLPVDPEVWREKFNRMVKCEKNEYLYLEASSGELKIDGGELGQYLLRFERDTPPLRWVTQNRKDVLFLRLIDDTDTEGSDAVCAFYSMEQPLKEVPYKAAEMLEGIYPSAPGGLYFVKHGSEHFDRLLVSSGLAKGKGFHVLAGNSSCTEVLKGEITIATALHILALWKQARLVGFLAEPRKEQIVQKIHATIYEKLCGTNWAKAEKKYIENSKSQRARDEILGNVSREKSFKAALKANEGKFDGDIGQIVCWYTGLASRYNVCTDSSSLCEFAVMLACRPYTLLDKHTADLDEMLEKSKDNLELIKGARFSYLLSSPKLDRDVEMLRRH